SLSLHADGFHSKWSTGKVTTHPRTYEILRIDATQERIVGFVWIGHAAVVPDAAPRPDWRERTSTVP
nr:hypothetical protein [Myxococcales bacterium]